MPNIPIVQIDAFTSQPFGGNPAAVVLDAAGLSDALMQSIAKEMNLSETAFLTPPTRAAVGAVGADYRLRWFTPGAEVTFCGHATVATGHALYEAGRFTAARVTFETLGGTLGLARTGDVFWLEPEPRVLTPYTEPVDGIIEALGLGNADCASWGAPTLTPERDLMLPCTGLDALRRSHSSSALAEIGSMRKLRGFALISRETLDPASSTHSRFYAPQVGVPEDPVTGSMHASLAEYMRALGLVGEKFQAEQGDLMGRPGRLQIETKGPRVGGRAVTVLRGDLTV
jgi:trans-2,3-dihydro-3-hydroxyanthranilate isomerase